MITINISNCYYSLRRVYDISFPDLVDIIEAYIYFNSINKEHLIDDIFNTGYPFYNSNLLDYNDFDSYISRRYTEDEVFIGKLHVCLNSIYKGVNNENVYDVDVDGSRGVVLLRLTDKGNVFELRYIDLIRMKQRGII